MGNRVPKDKDHCNYEKSPIWGDIEIIKDKKLPALQFLIKFIANKKDPKDEKSIQYWQLIKNADPGYSFMIIPTEVRMNDDNTLIGTFVKDFVRLKFENFDYSLRNYTQEAAIGNPFIAEITLLTLLAITAQMLIFCEENDIRHFNIQPESFILKADGAWCLLPPLYKTKNLTIASKRYNSSKREKYKLKEDTEFLIPISTKKFSKSVSVKSDIYSAGLTLIHSVYKFKTLDRKLDQQTIDKQIGYLKSYYSSFLVDILTKMTRVDEAERIGPKELKQALATHSTVV